ncbi:ABC transporter ATP-binding protein [Actinoalloteichus spitiensis]|uniref:ABC transporter ATP-binding protein n=1 Tax=Actinoalloteichus spitiensis TaxID=252394 RepID=UPI000362622B|nr:ABC transporter ATP-binding protein [Actinoalloteichus spitiensis]
MEPEVTEDVPLRGARLRKVYGKGENRVPALRGVTVSFPRASFTAVMGPSGSGKSTLLRCLAGLESPTEGEVVLGSTTISALGEPDITRFRRDRVGFVFQSYNLLPALTVRQNVELPMRLAGRRPSRADVRLVLEQVGLADRASARPAQLSGGQQQRVAVARALVSEPSVLFADEPTGALDTNSSRDVMALLRNAADRHSQTVVMVTHDPVSAAWADRVVFLSDGEVHGELVAPSAAAVAEQMTTLGG